MWNHKRPEIANTILSTKNKAEGIILPNFRLYYKAIVIKTIWTKTHRQQNTIQSPETTPRMCTVNVPLKWAPRVHNGERMDSLVNGVGEQWISVCKRMKLNPCITSHTEIHTKWIKHLKVKPESVKLQEKNRGKAPWSWE